MDGPLFFNYIVRTAELYLSRLENGRFFFFLHFSCMQSHAFMKFAERADSISTLALSSFWVM